jgi:hypothetical protein
MTKYFCDRCKKPSDDRLEYVSIPDRGAWRNGLKQTAELCYPCLGMLITMFKGFMNGGSNG